MVSSVQTTISIKENGRLVLYNALSPLKAKQLEAGKFSDGQGLYLVKQDKQRGKWILRLSIGGRRREMGLGRWPDVTIAEARERATEARKTLRDGLDPIEERAKAKFRPMRLTVKDAVDSCFKAKQAELKNDGQAGRWMSPLSVHILPKIGKRAIEDMDQHMLKSVLEPIWHEKPDVARKAVNRLNLTLKHAAALGLEVDLQATMKVRALLGKRRHEAQHIPSLPYADAPAFYRMLCERDLVSCYALCFLMLTVARSGEVRFATYAEIDNDVWVIPAARTKTGREHRVPLTDEALQVIESARQSTKQTFLFPSPTGKPISDATMSKFMKDNDHEARPHGFRATFRTWAENETDAAWEDKEAALGHQVDGQVARAYQRSDRVEKRRNLLRLWEQYLTSV